MAQAQLVGFFETYLVYSPHTVRSIMAKRKADELANATPKGIAVVTGASRGIGAAVASALAREGYTVAVNFKSCLSAAIAVVKNIQDAGGEACSFQADVSVESEVVSLFEKVAKTWSDKDLVVLVNNAGIIGNRGSLETVDTQCFHNVINANVLGPLICCREFAKKAAKGSRIVNVSSGSAYIGQPGLYAMSKGALNSMQAWLVRELTPKGIRMNTVSPGMTRTDMIADVMDNFDMSNIPQGRFGEPEEVADGIVFLCSEKSSYISGSNLRIAGGRPPGTTIG